MDTGSGQTKKASSGPTCQKRDIPLGARADITWLYSPATNWLSSMNPTPYPGASQPYETHTVTWLHQQEVLKLILDSCAA